jgi:methylenetetrahydrofolate--tRNA-(uracil-5-)-methyltransferase
MNINYGLLPPAPAFDREGSGKRLKGKEKARAKRRAISLRALADLEVWLGHASASSAAAE